MHVYESHVIRLFWEVENLHFDQYKFAYLFLSTLSHELSFNALENITFCGFEYEGINYVMSFHKNWHKYSDEI